MSLTLYDEAIYVDDYTYFGLILDARINTSVTISINGENRIIGLVNGSCVDYIDSDPDIVSLGDYENSLYHFPAGTYKLKATYAGDDKHAGCTSNEVTLTVNKIATSISVSDISPIQAGDDAVITVTMTPTDPNVAPINAIATLTVGGTEHKVAIVNGTGTCYIPNLTAGTYDVTASYATDDKFIGSTSIKQQLVVKEKSGADEATPLPKNAVATVTMTPASMNTIAQLTVGDNTYYVPVINGTGTYTLPQMEKGTYYVQASYAGEFMYAASKSDVQSLVSMANVALADNADNGATLTALNDYPARVTLSGRTLTKDGTWNTLCLPFSLSAEQIAESPLAGAVIKEMDSSTSLSNDGLLTLNFKDAQSIEAGKAYIVKWETKGENIVNPLFHGVTISNSSLVETESTDGKVKFVGQYSPFAIDNDNINEILFIGSGNKIGYSKNPRQLKSCRAHFWVQPNGFSAGARVINIDFGDGMTTSINLVEADDEDASANGIYSLDGRRVKGEPTQKGVYIMNGKKVVK
jgi:hypothetical protein